MVGRWTTYIERFWRFVKYDYTFLNPLSDVLNLYNGIKDYIAD